MSLAGRALLAAIALAVPALWPPAAGAQGVKGSYLYALSTFTGSIREDFSRIALDRQRDEVYGLYQNLVRVFNDSGMEVYRFGDDLDLGQIVDLAVDDRGDILLLTHRDGRTVIVRCDFRGRPRARFGLRGLPSAFAEFAPNRIVAHGEGFALASTTGLQVVTADGEGNALRSYDLFSLLDLEEKDRGTVELGGFSVDGDGNMLMTVPVLFRAVILTPDGKINWFGKASGAPGGFNIASGIARDGRGNILVVDRLKGSVQVFDPRFAFLGLFATRGYRPDQLIFPADLVVDGHDRVYVTQMGRRGISVFKLTYR